VNAAEQRLRYQIDGRGTEMAPKEVRHRDVVVSRRVIAAGYEETARQPQAGRPRQQIVRK
jgi:hypothetical protein